MKKYKAILFDMDGVIVDSMHRHSDSWQSVFREYGIDIPKEEIFEREGMPGLLSIVDILKTKGFDIPSNDELQKLLKKKLSIFEANPISVEVFPAVPEMLKFVHSKNTKSALVTGSLRRTVNHMLPEDILSCFDVIVTVDDYGNGKPHPEPFRKAIASLGLEPRDALAIENAPLGIISAKAAGADCYALETTLDRSYLSEADMIFENHEALYEYLREIL